MASSGSAMGSPTSANLPRNSNDARFMATPERLSELDEINRTVNKMIEPATDFEIYGVNELWTIPYDRGDCEDFALLKRRLLMERGWPASSLLMTVVRDEKNEGHAILTARTTQGDFVLDNKNEEVRLWTQSPYHYVMRRPTSTRAFGFRSTRRMPPHRPLLPVSRLIRKWIAERRRVSIRPGLSLIPPPPILGLSGPDILPPDVRPALFCGRIVSRAGT